LGVDNDANVTCTKMRNVALSTNIIV